MSEFPVLMMNRGTTSTPLAPCPNYAVPAHTTPARTEGARLFVLTSMALKRALRAVDGVHALRQPLCEQVVVLAASARQMGSF